MSFSRLIPLTSGMTDLLSSQRSTQRSHLRQRNFTTSRCSFGTDRKPRFPHVRISVVPGSGSSTGHCRCSSLVSLWPRRKTCRIAAVSDGGAQPDWVYTESSGWVKVKRPPPPQPPQDQDQLLRLMAGAWNFCLHASGVVVEKLTSMISTLTPPTIPRSAVEVCVKGALVLGLLLLVKAMLSILLTVGAVLLVSYMSSLMLKSGQQQTRQWDTRQVQYEPPSTPPPRPHPPANFTRGRTTVPKQGDIVDVWRDAPRKASGQ